MAQGHLTSQLAQDVDAILQSFGVERCLYQTGGRTVHAPATGDVIANVQDASASDTAEAIARAAEAFRVWRLVPAPRRGELVRLLGTHLRAAKDQLGRLVTIEAGKIASEGRGEVQEM